MELKEHEKHRDRIDKADLNIRRLLQIAKGNYTPPSNNDEKRYYRNTLADYLIYNVDTFKNYDFITSDMRYAVVLDYIKNNHSDYLQQALRETG